MKYLSFLLTFISVISPQLVWGHGGIPRVLEIRPPHAEYGQIWVTDTLGLFLGGHPSEHNDPASSREWQWLCDDAVDPMLGVDAIGLIDETTILAVARSGLYRSEDRGCSFLRVISPLNEHSIGSLSLHPNDPRQVALFTQTIGRENQVWWSSDAGLSWTASNLLVNGMIKSIMRHPDRPEEIWVSHAEGIGKSIDGGKTFQAIATNGFGIDASPRETRLLKVSRFGVTDALWVSLDRYPTASLLLSLDEGATWREIHRVNDSYEQLAITSNHVWVSTPFEGLFTYELSEAEWELTSQAWSGFWRQYDSVFISCLTPDPRDQSIMWACGRANPTGWIVGKSSDQGASWDIVMSDYAEAAGQRWDCPSDSQSLVACETRCLDEGCDPSGLMQSTQPPIIDMAGQERSVMNTEAPSGCLLNKPSHPHTLFLIIFSFLSLIFQAAKPIKKNHQSKS